MTEQWFQARLNPSSPRYLIWRKIFNQDEIPILSPTPVKGKLDGQDPEFIYLLDWNNIVGEESDRLINFVAEKYSITVLAAAEALEKHGFFPIRRDDCLISATLPHFI